MDLNNLLEITEDEFQSLSESEQDFVLKILKEYQDDGRSKTLDDLYYCDYEEIPVDIITFIKHPRYLGKAWHTPDGKCKLFPYWEKRLKELFPDNIHTSVNNAIFSGARGLGKSEVAVTCALYMMYRLMCLRDPHQHLNLKPSEKVAFAFMNITEILAMDIGVSKFQSTVQLSPWFLEHGTITGRNELIWNPPPWINIIIGSQPRHTIGQAIYYCLGGDTEIITSDGIHKIKDLVDSQIKVLTINNDGNLTTSEICTVKQTKTSNIEYQIELEDGTVIKCTPEHRFMLKDGSYKEAQYLTVDDELFDTNLR